MSRLLSAAALAGSLSLTACAGSVDGEVDGDAVPALLSGAWFASDVGDRVQVTVMAASHLDVCGTAIRRFQGYTEVIEGFTDDVEGGDTVDGDDVSEALDAVDAETAPGADYWTVITTLLADDTDEIAGESFDTDTEESESGALALSVCHQSDLPNRDDDGFDKNADCFGVSDGKIEVGAFSEDGSIDFSGDAELVDEDGDDAGDVTVRVSAGACPELEDARDDFFDALSDFFEAGPPGEGEGEGEGECSIHQDCTGARQLCDSDVGFCAAPESLAQCSTSFGFSPRSADPAGPLIFDATFERSFDADLACSFGVAWSIAFEFIDAEGDAFFASNSSFQVLVNTELESVTGASGGGSGLGGFAAAIVCATDGVTELSVKAFDDGGNGSNVACAASF